MLAAFCAHEPHTRTSQRVTKITVFVTHACSAKKNPKYNRHKDLEYLVIYT